MFIQVSQVNVIWLFMHYQSLNLRLFRSLMYEKQSLCYKICLVLWDIINLKKKKKKRGCLYEENKPN